MSQPPLAGLQTTSVAYGIVLTATLGVAAARTRELGRYTLAAMIVLWLAATALAISYLLSALRGHVDRPAVVAAYAVAAVLLLPLLAAPREAQPPSAPSAALATGATVAVLLRLAVIA
ncbi:MAG: hypothetical protein QM679_10155 [Patulibacter sp.]